MTLEQIYSPVSSELEKVKDSLVKQFQFSQEINSNTSDVINYFFQSSGKLLRPALVLLSMKAVSGNDQIIPPSAVELAVVMELIHSASLIHDDILDESLVRRGQVALDKIFDPKMAVLAGDLFFTRAFSLISKHFSSRVAGIISNSVEQMCRAEIDAADGTIPTYTGYINLMKNKTAHLMSACCECASLHCGTSEETAASLAAYGLHFGLAYQLLDDYVDQDVKLTFSVDQIKEAVQFAAKAKTNIHELKDSEYKQSLVHLAVLLEERSKQLVVGVKI